MKLLRLLPILVAVAVLTATLLNAAPLFKDWQSGMDGRDRPLFTDFISFWSAGHLGLEGRAEKAYDLDTLLKTSQRALPDFTAKMPYHYPPFTTMALMPFAKLPYVQAAALFQIISLTLLLIVLGRHLNPTNLLLLLAAPALGLNVLQGQNALLTAALLTGGVLLLDKRPILAGILLGCLFYKPHFALLTPFLLMVDKNHRALAAQIVTVLALSLAADILFGPKTWQAFLANAPQAADLLSGGHVKLAKMGSTFAAARMWGLDTEMAWAAHAAVALIASLLTVRIWHRGVSTTARLAALSFATLLISPFQYDYDLALLLPALLLWVNAKPRAVDWALIALIWLLPYLDLGILEGINNIHLMPPLLLLALARLPKVSHG